MQVQCPIHWQPAPENPSLEPDQIHVWRLRPDALFPPDLAWLTDDEETRLRAMSDVVQQERFLGLRYQIRQILGGYLDCEPASLAFQTRPGGKPALKAGPEFNLTHSDDLILLTIATQPVGIDVERLRVVPRRVAIARRVLGEAYAQELSELPEAEQDAAFLQAWTAMEARQKCHGEGVFGRRIAVEDVGRCAFVPVEGALASLAWMHPDSLPQILFYAD